MIICSKCNKIIPLDELTTSGKKRKKDGFRCFARLCRKCRAVKAADYRKRNPKKYRASNRRHYEKNHFQYSLYASRKWAKRKGHAPCAASVEQLKAAFTGKCHVCGTPEVECRTRLHCDHNHETGEFRGWLCDSCNRGLGYLKDSAEVVLELGIYLEKSQARI